jgi:aryl-alcohol dehydrogenase-like predicted oxidoreductase
MGQPPSITYAAFDAFWKAGGNTFDSAHCYGDNTSVFGGWIQSRGLENEVVYFDKGCHPYGKNRVTREDMRSDIEQNHQKLGVRTTDFFVLHRDDPEVPVGNIIQWLNELKDEGRIRVFGGSNWTHYRIAEANAYAAENGLQGMSLNNPNISLALAQDEMWAGCVTVDQEGRAWHEQNQFPLFAWSSMARGYFAHADETDRDVKRVWDNAENRLRRERAEQLAKEKKVSAPQIALAWTLHQPYPVFALCGLRQESQVHEAVEALQLELSPAEVHWLEHGEA